AALLEHGGEVRRARHARLAPHVRLLERGSRDEHAALPGGPPHGGEGRAGDDDARLPSCGHGAEDGRGLRADVSAQRGVDLLVDGPYPALAGARGGGARAGGGRIGGESAAVGIEGDDAGSGGRVPLPERYEGRDASQREG